MTTTVETETIGVFVTESSGGRLAFTRNHGRASDDANASWRNAIQDIESSVDLSAYDECEKIAEMVIRVDDRMVVDWNPISSE